MQCPVVVLADGAGIGELRATLTSLREHTDSPFVLAILDRTTRESVADDAALRAACPGEASAREALLSFRAVLTSCESDLIVLEAGVVLSPGWLLRLQAAAYSDSVAASASAVVEREIESSVDHDQPSDVMDHSTPLRSTLELPHWGAVYIRRDALRLTARRLPSTTSDELPVHPTLESLLSVPGLLHKLAPGVVVRSPRERLAPTPSTVAPRQRPAASSPSPAQARMRVMVDGRCLDMPLSGTQVHVLSLLKALEETGAIALSVLLPRRVHSSAEPHLSKVDAEDGAYTIDRLPSTTPAIFHRPYQFSNVAELAECRTFGQRLVLTHQDMILDRTPDYHPSREAWEGFRATTASAFAAADRITCFSRHAANDAAADGDLCVDRLDVVPPGVDHALPLAESGSDVSSDRFSELAEAPFLLSVGGAFHHKNRLFALSAYEHLTYVLGWSGRLCFTGDHPRSGSSVADEEAFVTQRLADASGVLDLGWVTDTEKTWLYEHAELVLFPSLYEGFGLIPFEAAARGTPCVYGWRSSLPEYLPPEGGVLEGWDLSHTCEALLEIMQDDARAARLVQAIQRAGAELTWTNTARCYVDVYRRALAAPARTANSKGELGPTPTVTRAGLTAAEQRLVTVYRRRRLARWLIDGTIGSVVQMLRFKRSARMMLGRRPNRYRS
jgi:glycosyltransferase involved in cell wall biosynthesis